MLHDGRRWQVLALVTLLAVVRPAAAMASTPPTPTPSGRLSSAEAAELAAKLANDECDRLYERRPFAPSQYPVDLVDERFAWGRLDPGGEGGFSAEVSFDPNGGAPKVKCYWSTDSMGSSFGAERFTD